MIWVWIGLSIFITLLLCRGKAIRWEHYIWMLFPVELYGVSIAGATIKPYMIFGAVIFLVQMIEHRGQIPVLPVLYLLVGLTFVTDLFNGFMLESVMQHLLFALMCIILVTYICRISWDEENRQQLADITTATVIGFGIIFIFAYVLVNSGMELGGLYTIERTEPGIIMGFSQIGGSYEFRLRGFTIDPNSCITVFVPGFCFAVYDLFTNNGSNRIRNTVTVVIYAITTILTGSRTAVIITLVAVVMLLISAFRQSIHKRTWIVCIVIVVIYLVFDATFLSNGIIVRLQKSFVEFMLSRSTLDAEDGRTTIWITNTTAWWNSNGILFGVGQNQIKNYTSLGLECHNTWLEWICGTGILVGPCMCVWFLSAPFRALGKAKRQIDFGRMYLPLILSHIALIICLSTIDHIANPAFLAVTIFLHIFASENDREEPLANTYRSISHEEKI